MNTVVLTTSFIVSPAPIRTSRTFLRHCAVCSATPPGAIFPSGSSGVCPETNTISPEETPCEYGPIAAGALAVMIWVRFMISPQRRQQLLVGLVRPHELRQRLDRLEVAQARQVAAQLVDAVEVRRREQLLFLARAAVADLQRREDAHLGRLPVQHELHVARALELLEDDVVHLRARVDE